MKRYFKRNIEEIILKILHYFPAIAIVGPRQVGKTSLVKAGRSQLEKKSIYLDLEDPDDLVKLNQPSLFLEPLENQTVILDEVQRLPSFYTNY